MPERSETLAKTFQSAVNDLISTIEGCSDAQWQATCGDEQWSVAATAHHVAAQWPLEKEYLDAVIRGGPSPTHTWDSINARNEARAKEFSGVAKQDVISMLRAGSGPMAAFVRGLSDKQLDTTMALPLADNAQVSTQQLIEGGVLIDHAVGHLRSIRGAG